MCIRDRSVWTGRNFISPRSIARSWNCNGPFLYGIPHLLVSKEKLISALSIQNDFMIDHYTAALEEIFHAGKLVIDDRELSTISDIANKLAEQVDKQTEVCYLPDVDGIMRPTKDLAYSNAQWCQIDEECHFIHHQISRPTALKLGVIPVRSKALQLYESTIQELSLIHI